MKRLLCIVSSLDTGGAETFLMKIYRKLPQEYKIDFIVSKEDGFYETEVRQLGGEIYKVPLRTKHPIRTFIAIKNVVKNNSYHTILKLCDTPIGYFDLIAAKKGGAKKICVRSCNAASNSGRFKEGLNNILRPFFNNITDVKIAPSYLAAEYTFGKTVAHDGNVIYLHNGVDVEEYCYKTEDRDRIRKELKITKEQLVVGHIGRFNEQKNHMFLLEIFAEIKKKRSDAILFLVGDGKKKADILFRAKELKIQDSVILLGTRSDIPALLSAMDIFVFPSFYEGMPNTIIEAQAVGVPCVLSDTITKEAKITSLLTYLPLSDSAEKWADIVLKKIENKHYDTKKELIQAGYDIKEVVEEFVKVII